MMNLLPQEIKSSYRYGRLNVSLRRWVLALLLALVGLGVIGTYGFVIMHRSETSFNHQISATETQLQRDKLNQTKQQVQDISNSLKLAVKVLSNEVLFSKLLQQIGSAMPNGTVLTGLTIAQVKGGLELSADSTSYTSGTQIQVNLADPNNKIFSKVDIESIKCTNSGQLYPCIVQLRALFNGNNRFLFINQGNKA